jgi:hypothetical protein
MGLNQPPNYNTIGADAGKVSSTGSVGGNPLLMSPMFPSALQQ